MLVSCCVIVMGWVVLFASVWYAGTKQIVFIGKSEGSVQPIFSTRHTVNTNAEYAGEATLGPTLY